MSCLSWVHKANRDIMSTPGSAIPGTTLAKAVMSKSRVRNADVGHDAAMPIIAFNSIVDVVLPIPRACRSGASPFSPKVPTCRNVSAESAA